MRLIVWMLGVESTLAALMNAYHVAPGWVWVFWSWLALWALVGLAVAIAAVLRLAGGGRAGSYRQPEPRRSVPPGVAQKGE